MKKIQLSLDHLSMIKLYCNPQESKEQLLENMKKSFSYIQGNEEFYYEYKVLAECIDVLENMSANEFQQLDFSEVIDYEEVVG